MTFANIKDDVINHLTGAWNSGACSMPNILDGDREISKGEEIQYTNYIKLYDDGLQIVYKEPTRTYVDEFYNAKLVIGSSDTKEKRDSMLSEVQRILAHTGMTGYDNYMIKGTRFKDDASEYKIEFYYLTIRYNQAI